MPEKPNLPEDGSNLDNQPTQPYLPPEIEDSQATRLQSSENRTRNMPPVKDSRLVPPPPQRASYNRNRPAPEKPKRGAAPPPYEAPRVPTGRSLPQPRSNPLSLPIWSVLLMLFMVCGGVSCVVVAVFGLGGRSAPALPPQFVVITAAPSLTPEITIPALSAPPTLPVGLSQQAGSSPIILAGPTLAPIVISPTPETIGVGKSVLVDSKESGLNVRSAPGVTTGSSVLFVVDDGALFNVVDGPAQADGYTWWKIQNPNDPTQSGWAASVFLEIAPKPQT